MGDRFEELCRSLQRRGYYVHLTRMAVAWQCELACGNDVLDANKPRPRATGKTVLEAVELATAGIEAGTDKNKSTSLAAGLPRGDR